MAVPLGPRTLIGVVWALKAAGAGRHQAPRCDRAVSTCRHDRDPPQIRGLAGRLLSSSPRAMCCAWCCARPAPLKKPSEQIAYRATGQKIRRMTPQRQRVLEVAARRLCHARCRTGQGGRRWHLGGEIAGQGRRAGGRGASRPTGLPAARPECRRPRRFPSDQQRAAQELRAVVASAQRQGHAASMASPAPARPRFISKPWRRPWPAAGRCCCCCPKSR